MVGGGGIAPAENCKNINSIDNICAPAHSACLDARADGQGRLRCTPERLDDDQQRRFQMLVDFRAALEEHWAVTSGISARGIMRSNEAVVAGSPCSLDSS